MAGWKELARACAALTRLGIQGRRGALRWGVRCIRAAAEAQEASRRTMDAAAGLFESRGLRGAWAAWSVEAAAHRVAVLMGADGGVSFERRATRGALHAMAEHARLMQLVKAAARAMLSGRLGMAFTSWQSTCEEASLAASRLTRAGSRW